MGFASLRLCAFVLAAVSGLVVACSGGDAVIDDGTGTSSGTTTSSGSSSRRVPPSDGWGGWGASSGVYTKPPPPSIDPGYLDIDAIQSITVGQDVCGKMQGTCADAQSFTVDFLASTLTHVTCVEVATGDAGSTADAKQTRPLTHSQLEDVKKILSGIRTSNASFDGWDGPIETLEVTTKGSGTQAYSPAAGCSKERFKKIESGFDELWATVSAL